jgi:hypothetical protein
MIAGWFTVAVNVGAGLLARAHVLLQEVRPVWGQGVWGGEPGPEFIEEQCRFSDMPDYDGPARP